MLTWDSDRVSAKLRLFCDGLPRDIWRHCKDELRCLKCTKRFSDWRNLKKHMDFFCQMEPLYPCPYCTHRARIPTLLKYHIRREHIVLASIEMSRWSHNYGCNIMKERYRNIFSINCKCIFVKMHLFCRKINEDSNILRILVFQKREF